MMAMAEGLEIAVNKPQFRLFISVPLKSFSKRLSHLINISRIAILSHQIKNNPNMRFSIVALLAAAASTALAINISGAPACAVCSDASIHLQCPASLSSEARKRYPC